MMQDWFRNAKLGIFIHYGIYAVGDVSESWSFHNGNISYEDYMKQCEGFTASKFDAKKWAELFQKAGAQYVVMTAKHHDGVALFDTGYSDLSVVKKTPAARDLVKEYTAAMREAGLKVGLYYSLIDWSDPRYRTVYPEGMKKEDCLNDIYGSPAGKEEDPEKWQEFLEFNNHQLKELMSNYGTVDLLWFDGDWERSAAQWKMPEFREYLHTLNPNVVLNSRMQGYGDYETPEQGIPLYGPKGEWEFCTTINDSWGYRPSDNDYKSSGQIVRMFCDCITLGGRMLLDIGPKEDGTLDERQEKVLLDLGGWIHDHEEAVFGTVVWDYSEIPFNLSGRINLLYCFFWGFAAVAWFKVFYPRFSAWIECIPSRIGKPVTWVILVFMICNMVMSGGALLRYNTRTLGMPATSGWEVYMDAHYGDDVISRIYPNAIRVD